MDIQGPGDRRKFQDVKGRFRMCESCGVRISETETELDGCLPAVVKLVHISVREIGARRPPALTGAGDKLVSG